MSFIITVKSFINDNNGDVRMSNQFLHMKMHFKIWKTIIKFLFILLYEILCYNNLKNIAHKIIISIVKCLLHEK